MKTTRTTWAGLWLGLGLALAGCGGDDPGTQPHTAATLPLREGTWRITETTTQVAGDTDCGLNAGVETTEEYYSPRCADTGTAGGGLTPCDYHVSGEHISVDCSQDFNVGSCASRLHITGEGTVTATAYDVTFTISVTSEGPASECGAASACRMTSRVQGTWVRAAGTCSSDAGAVHRLSPRAALATIRR